MLRSRFSTMVAYFDFPGLVRGLAHICKEGINRMNGGMNCMEVIQKKGPLTSSKNNKVFSIIDRSNIHFYLFYFDLIFLVPKGG